MTGTISDVMPEVARSLGLTPTPPNGVTYCAPGLLSLPRADRVVVMLVDGLGEELLSRVAGHAPFLTSLRSQTPLSAGFPSTTATSMGSFGTGLLPGAHGLVGYEVLDPATGRILNELSWDDGPDPRLWQPHRTVFEQTAEAGVDTVHIGPGYFDGSGLTVAALRGPRFVAAKSLNERVDATVSAIRGSARSLVYLYWGDVDRIGHERGVASQQWLHEVEQVDLAARTLVRRLPAGTLLVITADHGMVDVPFDTRIDLADSTPEALELRRGVHLFGGEPRAPMLYCEPGAAPDVADRWRKVLGEDAQVHLRQEAVEAGWFGPLREGVAGRLGDVIVTMRTNRSVHDSRSQRSLLASLIGMHGSRTDVETAIPLLVHLN